MTILTNGQHVPIATIRKHLGKRVRWEKHGHDRGLLHYPGSKGSGILHEAVGRNLHIGEDWLWRPDLLLLETIEETAP